MSSQLQFSSLLELSQKINSIPQHLKYEEVICLVLFLIQKNGFCSYNSIKDYLEGTKYSISDTPFIKVKKLLVEELGVATIEKSKEGRGKPRDHIKFIPEKILAAGGMEALIKYWEDNFSTEFKSE